MNNKNSIFHFLKAINFFPRYAPGVQNWARKVLGISGKGKALTFSEQDKAEIRKGIDAMCNEWKNKL